MRFGNFDLKYSSLEPIILVYFSFHKAPSLKVGGGVGMSVALVPPGYNFSAADESKNELAGYDQSVITRIFQDVETTDPTYQRAQEALSGRAKARSSAAVFRRSYLGKTLKASGQTLSQWLRSWYKADPKAVKAAIATVFTEGGPELIDYGVQYLGIPLTLTTRGLISTAKIGLRAANRTFQTFPDQSVEALSNILGTPHVIL